MRGTHRASSHQPHPKRPRDSARQIDAQYELGRPFFGYGLDATIAVCSSASALQRDVHRFLAGHVSGHLIAKSAEIQIVQ